MKEIWFNCIIGTLAFVCDCCGYLLQFALRLVLN